MPNEMDGIVARADEFAQEFEAFIGRIELLEATVFKKHEQFIAKFEEQLRQTRIRLGELNQLKANRRVKK